MKKILALFFVLCTSLFAATDTTGPVISVINPQGTGAGMTGELRWKELTANGVNYIGFKSPDALAGNIIWTLPNADGTSGQVLTTNGSGILTWTSAGSGSAAFSAVTAGTNANALVVGTGGTLTTSGSGTITANAFSGILPSANGGLGTSTSPTVTQIPIGDGTGVYLPQTLSGDLSINASGVVTIGNLAITNAKIAAATIDLTSKVTGILPVVNGGSGTATATGTAGNIVLSISPTLTGHPTIEGVTSTGATGTGNFVFSVAPTLTGHPTIEGVTSTGATGTGNFVFAVAPTITGHPTIEGITSTGATGTGKFVFDTNPIFTTPNLGTPSTLVLSNATGLPVSTGINGLAAGIATFLANPSSVNLLSAMTSSTGTGNLVFATSPVLITPNIGTPSAGVLSSCTGLSLTTGVTGILPVPNGGTGLSTVGANTYGVIIGGTTATGNFQVITPGGNGTFLQSFGAGVAPQWVTVAPGGVAAGLPLVVSGSTVNFGTATGPTTGDATADAIVGASTINKKPLVIQTKTGNAVSGFEIQSGGGVIQYKFDNSLNTNEDFGETMSTAHTSTISLQSVSELITLNTGGTTTSSSSNLIPANSFIVGVAFRVTTAITTASSWSIGDSVSTTRFGTGIAVAATTTGTSLNQTNPCSPFTNGTATTITLTTNVNPGAGIVRVTVYYYSLVAPGS